MSGRPRTWAAPSAWAGSPASPSSGAPGASATLRVLSESLSESLQAGCGLGRRELRRSVPCVRVLSESLSESLSRPSACPPAFQPACLSSHLHGPSLLPASPSPRVGPRRVGGAEALRKCLRCVLVRKREPARLSAHESRPSPPVAPPPPPRFAAFMHHVADDGCMLIICARRGGPGRGEGAGVDGGTARRAARGCLPTARHDVLQDGVGRVRVCTHIHAQAAGPIRPSESERRVGAPSESDISERGLGRDRRGRDWQGRGVRPRKRPRPRRKRLPHVPPRARVRLRVRSCMRARQDANV